MLSYKKFLPIGLFFLLLLVYVFQNVLVIKRVNFFWAEEIIDIDYQADDLIGQTLLFNDVADLPINHTILYGDQQAYQVKNIYKILPNTLHVYLEKQQPVYQLKLDDQFYLVDDLGKIRKVDQAQDKLVNVLINQDFSLLDNQIQPATHQFLKQLSQALEFINFEKVVYQDNEQIIIYLDSGKQIILAESNLAAANIERLKILLNDLDWQKEGLNKNKIDLRFKFPVLK